MENSNIIGLVLTGGKSSRMGEDKGLLLLEGNTWAEHQAEKLHIITTNVYLSVNRTQLKKYSSIFSIHVYRNSLETLKHSPPQTTARVF